MVPDCSICGADVSMDEAVCFISAELYLMVRVTTDTAIKLKKRKSIFRGKGNMPADICRFCLLVGFE
jgi:hypothetical protein